ncbi:GNAT family N-acetyltransferase [Hymenobacter sp. BT175]|uniref:GNAT family N-acetyltransferase n=1 Tax=Hymenobacter translucens TaxID=2886507 RepID=UPI001D0E2629|nr:GNAT family protein [Hymenobacter translucens]MCC2545823.1 GNAT family N-acetyltransferase [Hymenobacter translucens]
MAVSSLSFDHYAIRPLVEADLEPYFKLVDRNRARLEQFFTGTVSRTRTLADTREFLADITRRVEARSYLPYLIVDDKANRLVGFLDLKNIDWNIPKAEVGCYMDADLAGHGVATRAFQVFCDYCFAHFQFEKLFLRTHESNVAARRVAERAGFQVEGIIRCDYKTTAGLLVDLIYYGRLCSTAAASREGQT